MQVSDNQVKEMIANISDPNMRAQYEASLVGATHVVKCAKPKTPVVIGERNVLGAWVDATKPTKSGKRPHGLRSTRQRLDGQTGFACRCGNYSITSEAEGGILTGSAPTRTDLAKIYEKQQTNPAMVQEAKDGSLTVDGFIIMPLGGGA